MQPALPALVRWYPALSLRQRLVGIRCCQRFDDILNGVVATLALECAFQTVQILVRKMMQADQTGVSVFGRAEQNIEFQLQRLEVSVLRVLNEKHHQKRDDRRETIYR